MLSPEEHHTNRINFEGPSKSANITNIANIYWCICMIKWPSSHDYQQMNQKSGLGFSFMTNAQVSLVRLGRRMEGGRFCACLPFLVVRLAQPILK